MEEVNSEGRSFELLRVQKVLIKGYEVEGSYISSVDIYESLTHPGITGFISIQDYQGFREIGYVFAGDEIIISFGVDGQEEYNLELKFVIYTDEGSKINPQNLYDTLQLGFCSPWLLDGLSKVISKPYKDKYVHEIIQEILTTECEGATIGFIEPTEQKLEHFLPPRWTPFHIIKYLMSFAINKDKIGGYILWTDLKTGQINCTTIDYLIKGGLGQAVNSFIILPSNPRYQGRIKHFDFESSYDSIRLVNNGCQNTKFYGFNFDKNEFTTTEDLATDLNATRLSNKFPIPSKYHDDPAYAKYKFIPLFPSTDNSIANDDTKINDMIDGALYNHYAFLTSDIFKMNIETLGDTKRRVGQLVLLEYPSPDHNSGSNDDSKLLKGNYLIREIRHRFSAYLDYKQYVTLVIDGYKDHKADMIEWKK